MLAIELGLPRPIPDLCLHRARTHNAALINTCAFHHSTSQLTVPLAQTRVSQERPRHLGLDARIQCLMRLARRLGRGPERLPWACMDGQRSTVPPGSGSRPQTRWTACGPGSGQRAQRVYCRRPLGSGSSDVAELKGSEEGQEREGSRSVGGLGPSPLATPSSE